MCCHQTVAFHVSRRVCHGHVSREMRLSAFPRCSKWRSASLLSSHALTPEWTEVWRAGLPRTLSEVFATDVGRNNLTATVAHHCIAEWARDRIVAALPVQLCPAIQTDRCYQSRRFFFGRVAPIQSQARALVPRTSANRARLKGTS
jgi:hypothetical protein